MQEKQKQGGDDTAAVQADELLEITLAALEDMKAVDVRVIDVRELTTITDIMVVASGTSNNTASRRWAWRATRARNGSWSILPMSSCMS